MRTLVCLVMLLASCGDDDCCTMAHYSDAGIDVMLGQDANPGLTEVALIPNTINRDVDVLFVIDDSSFMLDKQLELMGALPGFAAQLAHAPGFLPNLHIGVVSTDLGTTGIEDAVPAPDVAVGNCAGLGKDGVLQTGGATLAGSFLSNIEDSQGTRVKNYAGDLDAVLQQMVNLGQNGCTFEQPLEAMHRALSHPLNAGFLRPSARLAIILLSDEDDCSLAHASLLRADTTVLGALTSFRCTRFGIECDAGGSDPDQMKAPGTKSLCQSNEASAFLTPISRYKSLLSTVKADPRDVLFAAIVGPVAPFNVRIVPGETTISVLDWSCTFEAASGTGAAVPAVRTTQLANQVPHGSVTSICDADYPGRMVELAQQINGLVGDRCVQRPIFLPSACEAFDIDRAGTTSFVPSCATATTLPCFKLVDQLVDCRASNLKVEIMRVTPVSPDTWTSVRCKT